MGWCRCCTGSSVLSSHSSIPSPDCWDTGTVGIWFLPCGGAMTFPRWEFAATPHPLMLVYGVDLCPFIPLLKDFLLHIQSHAQLWAPSEQIPNAVFQIYKLFYHPIQIKGWHPPFQSWFIGYKTIISLRIGLRLYFHLSSPKNLPRLWGNELFM